jgi:hypothetical protein
MKCKKVFHGASKGRLCRSNRRAVRVFGDAFRGWQRLVREPSRALCERDRARRNLVRLTRKHIRPTGTVFASSALCTPHSVIKTDPSANRSRPAANCSDRSRAEPCDPQIDPAVREPCRPARDLIPAVREVASGQNSKVYGFREAQKAVLGRRDADFCGACQMARVIMNADGGSGNDGTPPTPPTPPATPKP